MFQNVFSTKGRIRRTEFALSYLIYVGAIIFTVSLAVATKIDLFYILTMLV
ncbi:hypothetical protein LPB85_06405 [Chryseobacterium sp. LC2016-27]|nr:hypothetical protein [Chryseobacterium sp. LC2016-27]MCD0455078.1 hypothetical protein [Chryseobacterium sp. LC2016-27]